MKKIYLSFLAVSVGAFAFGQSAMRTIKPFKGFAENPVKTATNINPHSKGAVLWSDDFTTPANWTPSTTGDVWTIGTTAPSGGFAIPAITSTSGGNFALFDSDLQCSGSQDATLTTAAPINLTGKPFVSLEFEEYYRKYQDMTYVGVSTDGGTTWTDIQVNTAATSNGYNNGANVNPYLVNVNISAAAGNQAAVLIRFHYTGGCDYAWMVDDVKIRETDNNDLSVSSEYYGFNAIPYTRIPVAQIQPADFSIWAKNVGAKDQTNSVLTVDVNAGTFTGTSAAQTILVGANDSLFSTTQYTPAIATGVPHNITMTVNSDSVDATQANNVATFPPFEITNFMYALDDYSITGRSGGAGPGGATDVEFEAGNYYDAVVNATATAIEVVVETTTPTTIDGVLYSYDGTAGTFTEISRSGFYTTTAADSGNAVALLLNVTPAAMVAGTSYFAAVHTFTEFYYGTSGSSPGPTTPGGTTSLIFYGSMTTPVTNENYYTTRTPMIRLNFDPTLSVNKVSKNVNFSVYPNPSNGIFNINLDANISENVTLSVRNIVGQTILTKQLTVNGSTKETISLANYDKGVYFLTIDSNKERKTVKLIVE